MQRAVIVLVSLLTGIACNQVRTSNFSGKPLASSEPGEVILVMDSLHWDDELGMAINKTFRSATVGLPRTEPKFTIRHVEPSDFQAILKYARHIVFIYAQDNPSSQSQRAAGYLTQNSLEEIAADTAKFLYVKQDHWARGQQLIFLYGATSDQLAAHILTHANELQEHLNGVEYSYVKERLFASKEVKGIGSMLQENHGFHMRIPNGFRVEYEDPQSSFIWLRSPGLDVDKNIWISYRDYRGEEDFNDPIAIRNRVTKEHIYDDKESNDTSYVVVETIVPPVIKEINFGGQYAKEVRGLWKTNNLSMGGPFISYVVADPYAGRLYYLDGFIYSPGKNQRELVREMEVILRSFSSSQPVSRL